VNKPIVPTAVAEIPVVERGFWIDGVVSLVVYSTFAAIVYIAHGAEPSLMIDHLAYMQQDPFERTLTGLTGPVSPIHNPMVSCLPVSLRLPGLIFYRSSCCSRL
jgi:hypothetical protein